MVQAGNGSGLLACEQRSFLLMNAAAQPRYPFGRSAIFRRHPHYVSLHPELWVVAVRPSGTAPTGNSVLHALSKFDNMDLHCHLFQCACQKRRVSVAAGHLRGLFAIARRDGKARRPSRHAVLACKGEGLFELRPRGREGIGRVFYCMQVGSRIVVLHSFVKKTEDTPLAELRIARKRLKEVCSNG